MALGADCRCGGNRTDGRPQGGVAHTAAGQLTEGSFGYLLVPDPRDYRIRCGRVPTRRRVRRYAPGEAFVPEGGRGISWYKPVSETTARFLHCSYMFLTGL